MTRDAIIGCLLGTAVGDSIGLPMENLSPRRASRLFPAPIRQRFVFGHGLVSDDTEHACLTAQALIMSAGEPDRFVSHLGWRMRYWLLGLPLGTGRATLRACVKLWLGFSPKRSGVWSAGNGPAMRAPILGVCFGHDLPRLRELIRLSTRITHTDPQAEHAAFAVALAVTLPPEALLSQLASEAAPLRELLERSAASAAAGDSTEEFARSLKLSRGVTGYVNHTVPVALHAVWRWPTDCRTAIESVIRCGGDTDSVAAIVGGILGAKLGTQGLPADWLTRLGEWPRSAAWLERLGVRLARVLERSEPASALWINPFALFVRNVAFDLWVLGHGVRRLLPPY